MYNEVVKAEQHAAERREARQVVLERKAELEAKWHEDPRLPVHEGWIAVYSEQHDRCYFANPETGESRWKPPHPRPPTAASSAGDGGAVEAGGEVTKWSPDAVEVKARRGRASCLLRCLRFIIMCFCGFCIRWVA